MLFSPLCCYPIVNTSIFTTFGTALSSWHPLSPLVIIAESGKAERRSDVSLVYWQRRSQQRFTATFLATILLLMSMLTMLHHHQPLFRQAGACIPPGNAITLQQGSSLNKSQENCIACTWSNTVASSIVVHPQHVSYSSPNHSSSNLFHSPLVLRALPHPLRFTSILHNLARQLRSYPPLYLYPITLNMRPRCPVSLRKRRLQHASGSNTPQCYATSSMRVSPQEWGQANAMAQ